MAPSGLPPRSDGKHVVFGQVVSGYSVIKAIEACGSRSGQTAADVMIADCGVKSPGKGATATTASLQPAQAAPRPAATAAAPCRAARVLQQQRRVALAGRALAPARRPAVAARALAVAAPARAMAVL